MSQPGSAPRLSLRRCSPSEPDVRRLLDFHHKQMIAQSPPGRAYPLELSAYEDPALELWAAEVEGEVAAVGAVRMLDSERAELKSMRTSPAHLRRGAARAVLEELVKAARRRGARIVSLETGSGSLFEPAARMYRTFGFEPGPAFGDYSATDFNRFFHLPLE